jgi:hypothetical protein
MLRRFLAVVGLQLLLFACSRVGKGEAAGPVSETCRPRKPDLHLTQLLKSESEWKLPDAPAVVVGTGRIQVLYGERYGRERGRFSILEIRVGQIEAVASDTCPAGLLPTYLGLAYSGNTTVVCNTSEGPSTSERVGAIRVAYGELMPNGSFAWTTLDDPNGDNAVVGFVALPEQVALLYEIRHYGRKDMGSSHTLSLQPSRRFVELHTPDSHLSDDKALAMFVSRDAIHVILRASEPRGWRDHWDLSYSLTDGVVTSSLLEQGVVASVPGRLERSCISGGAHHAPLSIVFPYIRYVDAHWTDHRIGQVRYMSDSYVDGLDLLSLNQALCPPAGGRSGWSRASIGTKGWVTAYQSESACKDGPDTMKIEWSSLPRSSEEDCAPKEP